MSANCIQRSPQFVAHHGEKLILRAIRRLGRFDGVLRRALLVYQESAMKLRNAANVPQGPAIDLSGHKGMVVVTAFSASADSIARHQCAPASPLGAADDLGTARHEILGIAIGLEQPQHAIDMREVRAVLFELAFELFDQPGNYRALLAEG